METHFYTDVKLGILGGGQLGRMLIQSGINFPISFTVLDPNSDSPCHSLCNFIKGDFTDYSTVVQFGQYCDVITIELENVNTKALTFLENKGKQVFPQPRVIELIQNKQLQKIFFIAHDLPTSEWIYVENRKEAMTHESFFPVVNKLTREGYDGQGVQVIYHKNELKNTFDAPGILEKWIDIDKEISIIVACDKYGKITAYPPSEMHFYPKKNILDHMYAPASIPQTVQKQVYAIAHKLITDLHMVGILAIEMFLTCSGELLINEIAPRPHNSGHHTIEACETSQYEQLLRILLGLPMGGVHTRSLSAMINLLGKNECEGQVVYKGIKEVLSLKDTHLHLYGKKYTKPFRKMGHVTILDDDMEKLKKKVSFVQEKFTVTT